MERNYDIVLFGASGYTGKLVLDKLVKTCEQRKNIKIAIAGRNEEKLLAVLKECAEVLKIDWISKIPLILADVDDSISLQLMAKQTRVVINCVGPYRLYGEAVIDACINQGTHHLDVCGETEFLEFIQLNYHERAQSNNAYVIGSCAYISGYTEMGVQFTEESFGGKLNEIESFSSTESTTPTQIHVGTWYSLIGSLQNYENLKILRNKLYPVKLPEPQSKLKPRCCVFYESIVNKWCLPFRSSDRSVVYRTQRYLHDHENKPDLVQFMPYMCVDSLFQAMFLLIGFMMLFFLAMFKTSRKLLMDYPRFFSMGLVSHEGATREQIENSKNSITFVGKGWTSTQTDGKPNSKIITRLDGDESGYGCTATFCVEAALVVLDEEFKMPQSGGVYTCGVAFRNTSFLKRLKQIFKFSIVQKDDN